MARSGELRKRVQIARPRAAEEPVPDAIADADVVIVATNHSEYSRPETLQAIADRGADDCLIVDPWNALGAGQVFAYASEVAALRA